MKTSHIVLGVGLVGGYLWYQDQKKREQLAAQQAAFRTAGQAPGALSSLFSGLIGGITSMLGKASAAEKSAAALAKAKADQAALAKAKAAGLEGYYGSLGAYGDGGSLGGCRGSLGCGKYGSLS